MNTPPDMGIATDVVAQAANLSNIPSHLACLGNTRPRSKGIGSGSIWPAPEWKPSAVRWRRGQISRVSQCYCGMTRGLFDGLVRNVDHYTDDWPNRAPTSDAASFR